MQEIPPYARLVAAGMMAAAAVGLLVNHFLNDSLSVARMMVLALAPACLFLGIGGIVEPKVVWAVGKYGEHLPFHFKIIGGLLAGAGVVVTLVLVFFVYPLKLG